MKLWRVLLLVFTSLVVLSACNLPIDTEPTPNPLEIEFAKMTIVAGLTETAPIIQPTFTPQETQWFPPTNTPQPGVTYTPIIEPTIKPTSSIPSVSVSVDTNCRSGPNIVYDYEGALLQGEWTAIVGKLAEKDWLLVENPDQEGTCWIIMQYAIVDGNLDDVPYVEAPVYYDWNGSWTFVQFQMTVDGTLYLVQTGKNVSGYFVESGIRTTYNGTLSENGQLFTGTMSSEGLPESYPIFFKMLDNLNQFIGAGTDGFSQLTACGYRGSSSYPAGCPLP